MIPDITTKTLQNVVDKYVQKGSTVECDGYRSYPGLEKVTVNASKYEPGDLKWVHTVIGNFKSFLLGTYHGSCEDYQPYLDFASTGDFSLVSYSQDSPERWLYLVLC